MPGEIHTPDNPTDRLAGILIERTEQLTRDTRELRTATSELREVSIRVVSGLEHIGRRLDQVEQRPDAEQRLRSCEDVLSEWKTHRDSRLNDLRVAKEGAENWLKWRNKILYALAIAGALGISSGLVAINNTAALARFGLLGS